MDHGTTVNGYISTNSGVIAITDYYSTPFAAIGYVKDTYLQNGSGGTHVLQSYMQYATQGTGNLVIHPVSDSTVYAQPIALAANATPSTTATGAQTTSFAYTWASANAVQMKSSTETLPDVSSTKDEGPTAGAGSADKITTTYDTGRVKTITSGGFTTTYGYDNATGALTSTSQQVGNSQPNITTSSTVDAFGRPLTVKDGNSNVTTYQYTNTLASSEMRTLSPIGPTTVVRTDNTANGSTVATYTVVYGTANTNAGSSSAVLFSLQIAQLDMAGRTVATYRYADLGNLTEAKLISSLQKGIIPANKTLTTYVTTYGYDSMGRQNATTDAVGTITRTVYDSLGRVVSTWIGTNDAGATDTNPHSTAAANNMVEVSENQYDKGGIGDSNLTQITLMPGTNGSGITIPNRVTTIAYDWQDRQIATDNTISTTYNTLDNLGEVTDQKIYDDTVSGVAGAINTSTNGLPNAPTGTAGLRAESSSSYEARGRVYQSHTDDIAQQLGTNSSNQSVAAGKNLGSLTTTITFDARDNAIETDAPGGVVTKSYFDGAGRMFKQTTGSAKVILNTQSLQYDANGNALLTTDTENSSTSNGPSRTSYVANFYDAANRITDTVNYGTNGGTAITTRPSTVPARTTSDGNDPYLLTHFDYNSAGEVQTTIDPRGIKTTQHFDAAGRVVTSIQADTNDDPTTFNNRKATYQYDGLDHQTLVTVNVPGQKSQSTAYVYGSSGFSNVISNDTLSLVEYPNPTTGAPADKTDLQNVEQYGFDALGEQTYKRERTGVSHYYTYNVSGQVTADFATGFSPAVNGIKPIDDSIQALGYTYDALGLPTSYISYGATPSPNTLGTPASKVYITYNGLGQIQSQSAEGSVQTGVNAWAWLASQTTSYQYSSDNGVTGNASNLVSMTYPNGRKVKYVYNSGVDADIGRVSAIADGGGTPLQTYTYLGLASTVTTVDNQPNLTQSYVGSGGTFTGLDQFGRIIDQNWTNTSTNTVADDHQYAYDADSNMLYSYDTVNKPLSALYQSNGQSAALTYSGAQWVSAYDPLNRVYQFSRGVLSASSTGGRLNTVSSPTQQVTYNRDDQGNLQIGNTTYNAQNEASNTTVDAAGNVKSLTNAAGDPTTVIYDAWGRPVRYSSTHVSHDSDGNTTTTTVSTQSVQYDALGRELSTFEATSGAATDQVQSIMLYNAQNQVIEVRSSPTATHPYEQYVYSGDGSGRMVLRDRDAAGANNGILNERLYVLQLPDGSTSALANTAGVVVERYVYDPLGNVQALQADGTAYAAYTLGTVSTADGDLGQYFAGATFNTSGLSGLTPTNTAGGTQYAWTNFYQGQRYERIAGIYDSSSGPRNPRADSLLKPDYSAIASGRNAYDPAAGGSWFDHHAGQIAFGAAVTLGAVLTIATAGAATPWIGGAPLERRPKCHGSDLRGRSHCSYGRWIYRRISYFGPQWLRRRGKWLGNCTGRRYWRIGRRGRWFGWWSCRYWSPQPACWGLQLRLVGRPCGGLCHWCRRGRCRRRSLWFCPWRPEHRYLTGRVD